MKIGFVSGGYLPAPGGVATSVVNFSKQLEGLGHKVFVFCPDYPEEKIETEDPQTVIRIPSYYSPLLKDFRLTDPFQAAGTFRKFFEKLDIVHVHLPTIMSLPARWLASYYDVPLFFTYHTNLELYIRHYVPGIPSNASRAVARFYTYRETKNGEKMFVPSTDMKDLLEQYNLDLPLEVLPSGIDIDMYMERTKTVKEELERSLREQFGIDDSEKILLYVGRVGSEKNVEFLLKAFDLIAKECPRAHFVIVGGGRGLGKILALVSKLHQSRRVHFTGYVEDERILAGYYSEADLFLFASLTETQGLVVAEAMASSTPVVAVDAPGVRDVLHGGQGGYLVDMDLQEFSRKAIRLLKDGDLLREKGEEALEVAKSFSVQRFTEQMLNSYEEAIERKRVRADPNP
ncbi:MAG: glycosyltransferase [Candidatus Acetothermia bacterium]